MSDDDLLDLQAVLAHQREDAFNLIARIDDHGFVRAFVSDDGAVALQRPDRKNFVDHGGSLSAFSRQLSVYF